MYLLYEKVVNIRRYSYGYGSGILLVGMDPYKFVTRKMSYKMENIATELYELVLRNKKNPNIESTDLSQKFNHCTAIMYYAGANLKRNSPLSTHFDCEYIPTDGSFARKANSQVENIPAVICSIGDPRVLNWKTRNIIKSKWSNDSTFSESYDVDSDTTITIINQLGENPCSDKNIRECSQYQHCGVSFSSESSLQELFIMLLTLNSHML